MEEEQNQVTERILNLTLEIIYLLTGKDYAVVKTSGQPSAPGVLSSDLQKKRKNNRKKILKATSQIIGLLAGEDWETEEETEDSRKGVKIENCTTQTDWSSIRNPSERFIQVEDEEISHHVQVQSGGAGGIKTEYSMAEGKKDTCAEQNQAFISQDGQYGQASTEAPPASLSPLKIEDKGSRQHFPGEGSVDPDLHPGLPGTDISSFPSNSDWIPEAVAMHKQLLNSNIYPCPECGRCFTNMPNRIRHMKIHRGLKPYSCAHCGKCFTRKSHLATHQVTHTNEKPFSCAVCGKRFKRESCLAVHNRYHTGERPFVCMECGKGFAQKSTLLYHQKVHRNEKN